MAGDKKGNVIIAAVILSAALCVCTVGMLYGMKKFQNNVIRYAEAQKEDVLARLKYQKAEALARVKYQKGELKRFVLKREARLRNFVRNELKGAKLEVAAK